MAKTEFGQELSSADANAVYLLKTEDDIITGIVSLQNGTDVNKHLVNLQEHIYTVGQIIGIVGENDPNALVYANDNIIANGDNRKVAIEKLDAQMEININNIASNLVAITQNASDIADIIAALGVDSGTSPLAVGIATLDADGKIPINQIPNTILQYQGVWDASTNTPTISDATGTEQHWYRVNVAGSQDLGSGIESYNVGDKVVHNGTIWQKWDTNDEVTSVFGRMGDVVAQAGDYNATQVGLGNVTNDAQLKRQGADFDTFTEKPTPVDDDIVLIEDSEDTLNKKKVKLSNLLGGGGGGGSFVFELTGDTAPLESDFKGISLFDFDFESEMECFATIQVPESYTPGNQIFLRGLSFFTEATSGNVLLRAETELINIGANITTTNFKHLSVNTELTIAGANATNVITLDLDLSTATGEIGGSAVAAGAYLVIRLFRDNTNETSPSTDDVRVLKYSPSVDFEG